MIDYDVAIKVLDTESFPQHNIAGLISGITFIVLFIQEKPLWWKEINAHTHTHMYACMHARTHARTHTHMHIYKITKFEKNTISDFFSIPV